MILLITFVLFIPLLSGLPNIEGYFFGNNHGKLHKAAEGAVGLMPSGLIDHLAFPFLGDSIGVGASFRQEAAYDAT